MKKGWEYKTLGEVAEFISGYTPPKEFIVSQGNIPYFKVAEMNLLGNELYLTRTNLYVERTKRIIPQGSIVFPKNGGAIFTNKKRILSQNSVVDLNTEALNPNKSYTTTEFLYYILQFIDLGSFDNGGGLPSINIRKMKGHPIPIPPLSEQEEIVSRLDKAFEKIDTLRHNAEKSITTAQQLFQSSLTNLLTPQPHWDRKTLGAVCEVINGLWKGKKEPFVNVGVIRNTNFTKDFALRYDNIEWLDVEARQFAKRKLCKGDLIVEKSGGSEKQPVGRAVLFEMEDGEYSFSNFTSVLRIKDKQLTCYYLYYYLLSVYLRGDTKSMQKATTGIHNIEMDKYLLIPIPIIPLPEQATIVTKLNSLSAKVKQLKDNYTRTVALCDEMKQALLKEVFE